MNDEITIRANAMAKVLLAFAAFVLALGAAMWLGEQVRPSKCKCPAPVEAKP